MGQYVRMLNKTSSDHILKIPRLQYSYFWHFDARLNMRKANKFSLNFDLIFLQFLHPQLQAIVLHVIGHVFVQYFEQLIYET